MGLPVQIPQDQGKEEQGDRWGQTANEQGKKQIELSSTGIKLGLAS